MLPSLGEDGMILEGVVTTLNDDGSVNISPMGPIVDSELDVFVFRPYQTSTTYKNLVRTGEGVFHITDEVDLIVRAAVGELDSTPPLAPAQTVAGCVLAGTCRYYEFRVESIDDSSERSTLVAKTTHSARLRDFVGYNRAQHAVLEAAILATRVHLLPEGDISAEMERLQVLVQKTGSRHEHAAFEYLRTYICQSQTVSAEQL